MALTEAENPEKRPGAGTCNSDGAGMILKFN
jgi:hypothetical protein